MECVENLPPKDHLIASLITVSPYGVFGFDRMYLG